ncbi:MAG: tRNA lysidine(34) synthetase TilS [Isosphaeraceae bacterium]
MNNAEPPDLAQSPAWLGRVRRQVERWCTAAEGAVWVVAVSGGSDSVGLLRILHRLSPELGLSLSVAHLDHGVRGDAARDDARFVEGLAAELGLPCDVGAWQPARPGHFEADARRARYAWLHEIAVARGAAAIAVGHTRDDQAETILHRIVRGTGLRGLAGMPARRVLPGDPSVTLLRPLLSVSRREIRDYLAMLEQDYRDDASNSDLTRTRARIRHDLLPRLAREYNPRVVEAIVRLGRLAGASERATEQKLIELEHGATWKLSHDQAVLRRDRLLQLPVFLRAELIRRVWRKAGWPEAGMSAKRWRRLASLARSRRINRLSIGGGIELSTTGAVGWPPDAFILKRQGAVVASQRWPARIEEVPLEVPGQARWVDGRISTVLDASAPRDETIDLDRIMLPLWVRAPVAGDRFEPLGMGGQSTPLADFFRGRGVQREERTRTPLLCDEAGIIWVVGHRIAARVKVTEETRRTLGLRWEPGEAASLELGG